MNGNQWNPPALMYVDRQKSRRWRMTNFTNRKINPTPKIS